MREEAVGGLHHSRRLPENGSLGIKRLVFKGLQQVIGEPQVLILTGPRQVGKATLMRHLESKCQAPGKRTRCLDLARRPASQQRQCGKRQCGTPISCPGIDECPPFPFAEADPRLQEHYDEEFGD